MENLPYIKIQKLRMEKGLPFERWPPRTFKHINSVILPFTIFWAQV